MPHGTRSRAGRRAPARPPTTAPHKHVTGARRLHRRHRRAGRARCTSASASPSARTRAIVSARPRRGARGARRRRGADRGRHPGRQRRQPGRRHDDPIFATGEVDVPRPAAVRGRRRRRATQARARRAARPRSSTRTCRRSSTSRRRARPGGSCVTEPLDAARAAMPPRRSPARRTASQGRIDDRRPGPFLSRRPGRARHPRRGRRRARSIPRPSTRARSSTWSPMCWACPTTP